MTTMAFVIPSKFIQPRGGIGKFFHQFAELANQLDLDWECVSDKPTKPHPPGILRLPQNQFTRRGFFTGAFPDKEINLDHESYQNWYEYIERIHGDYDYMFSQWVEPSLAIARICPEKLIHYTHHHAEIFDYYKDSWDECTLIREYFNEIHKKAFMLVCQHEYVKERLQQKFNTEIQILPIPLDDHFKPEGNYKNSEGVLFLGGNLRRKGNDEFLKVVKKSGLKAKILTRPKDVQKWEKKLNDFNIDGKISTVANPYLKKEFIKSARCAFLPYRMESFGIAVLECQMLTPTVLIEDYDWPKIFSDFKNVILSNRNDVVNEVQNAAESQWQNDSKLENWNKYSRTYYENFVKQFL